MPELIPRRVLFGGSSQGPIALSPSGSHIAFVAPWSGAPNVWLRELRGGEPTRITSRTAGLVLRLSWALDGDHVLFVGDTEGDENGHLYAYRTSDGTLRDLTPIGGVAVDVIGVCAAEPDLVAVALNDRDPSIHDAYRISLSTGERELAAENPGRVSAPAPHLPGAGWIADDQLRIRACTRAEEDGGYTVLVRAAEGDDWREVHRWTLDDARNSLVVSLAGDELYLVDSSASGSGRLVSLDTKTRELDVLLDDPTYDVYYRVLVDPRSSVPVAATVLREKAEPEAIDPRLEPVVKTLRKNGASIILGCDPGVTAITAYVDFDDRSPVYVVADVETNSVETVLEQNPELGPYSLAAMRSVSYRAPDGLTIHGYLTVPPDASPPVPLIVFPHGGPWSRDWWGYYPDVQWFANRGYACLQPNFRGSTGYGKAFLNAGNRQWGRAMLDDVMAGVDWAIQEGVADPQRLAIFGGSFGGYMTLAAIAFRPDVFACAVDLYGWGDLVHAMNSLPPYWGPRREQWYERVGHPERDRDDLWAQSPLSRVEDIRTALLVAHGANDVRVPKESSDQVVAAVREHGFECEYLVFDDEGHGFTREANQEMFLSAAEAFLARHLGGRVEQPT